MQRARSVRGFPDNPAGRALLGSRCLRAHDRLVAVGDRGVLGAAWHEIMDALKAVPAGEEVTLTWRRVRHASSGGSSVSGR